jgi:hypothetical protein
VTETVKHKVGYLSLINQSPTSYGYCFATLFPIGTEGEKLGLTETDVFILFYL